MAEVYSGWAGFRFHLQDTGACDLQLNPHPEGTSDHEHWWANQIEQHEQGDFGSD